MELHQKSKSPPTTAFSLKRSHQFLENVKSEFQKIQWTEGEEVRVYAKVVVLATLFLGFAIYAADLVIQKGLVVLEVLFKLIFG